MDVMKQDPGGWFELVSAQGRDVIYDLVVYVLWSDGRLSPDELSAARAAAQALRMNLLAFTGLFHLSGRAYESLGLDILTREEASIAYACAVWMAMADTVLASAEHATLQRLRDSLAVSTGMSSMIHALVARHARARDGLVFPHADERQVSLEELLDAVAAASITTCPGPNEA